MPLHHCHIRIVGKQSNLMQPVQFIQWPLGPLSWWCMREDKTAGAISLPQDLSCWTNGGLFVCWQKVSQNLEQRNFRLKGSVWDFKKGGLLDQKKKRLCLGLFLATKSRFPSFSPLPRSKNRPV